MKTTLVEAVKRAAFEAAEREVRIMDAADVAGELVDSFQDSAIDACMEFGLDYPATAGVAGTGPIALVASLCDAFVDAYSERAEQIARERGISAEPSGVPNVDQTGDANREIECSSCHSVIVTDDAIAEPAKFVCDDCAADAAGISADDVPHLKAIAAPTSSACKRQPWCNLQVGHAGACSASFMADGTVIS